MSRRIVTPIINTRKTNSPLPKTPEIAQNSSESISRIQESKPSQESNPSQESKQSQESKPSLELFSYNIIPKQNVKQKKNNREVQSINYDIPNEINTNQPPVIITKNIKNVSPYEAVGKKENVYKIKPPSANYRILENVIAEYNNEGVYTYVENNNIKVNSVDDKITLNVPAPDWANRAKLRIFSGSEKKITFQKLESTIPTKNIRNFKNRISNKSPNKIDQFFQVYAPKGDFENEYFLKTQIKKSFFDINGKKIYLCNKNSNKESCKKGKISSLISRKEGRFLNIMTFFNMVIQLKSYQQNSSDIEQKKSQIRATTKQQYFEKPVARKVIERRVIACFAGIGASILSPATLIACLPLFKFLFSKLGRLGSERIENFLKHFNEELFFELGKINENSGINKLNKDSGYRYFMYVKFDSSPIKFTKIRIAYVIKIHESLFKSMEEIIENKLKDSDIENLPNSVVRAVNNYLEILRNTTDKTPDEINKSIALIAKELHDPKCKGWRNCLRRTKLHSSDI